MGAVHSTYYASPQEESCLDLDDEFSPRNQNFTTDSRPQYSAPPLERQVVVQNTIYDRTITAEIIAGIEKELDLYEKVSLVYLLYDDTKIAFERLQALHQHQHTSSVLVEWSQCFKQTDNWQQKLLEALSLIQNYQVMCKLGYETSEVQEQFLSYNEKTSLINGIKRSLYYVCENLTNDETEQLISIVKRYFPVKNISFKEFDPKFLEFYISHWMAMGYISGTNLTILYLALQAIKKNDVANNLKLLAPNSFTSSSKEGRAVDYYHNEHFAMRDRIQSGIDEKCYAVNSKCPGICLIINQENFYTEPERDELLERRLPPGFETNKLENRRGTKVDCDKLSGTFNKFGFNVIVKNDLTHWEMESEIKTVVDMVNNHSSLFICILSHGIEGMVYGVNSIHVEVRNIRNAMCNNSKLKDKPKILILQSCQGTDVQHLTTDGENTEFKQKDTYTGTIPQTRDMLVFYATVPGYAAFRSPTEGSWFIQSLCDAILEEADQEHFNDICTLVQDKVCSNQWNIKEGISVGMVPVLQSTLRKKFYLPKIRQTECY